jgi:hypothetical protein
MEMPEYIEAAAARVGVRWAATPPAEQTHETLVRFMGQELAGPVAAFLAAAVVKQFLAMFPSFYARGQWKERSRLVRLLARRARS